MQCTLPSQTCMLLTRQLACSFCKQFSNFRFLAKIIYSLNIEIFAMVSSQDLGSSGGKHCKSVENTYGVVSPFKVDF